MLCTKGERDTYIDFGELFENHGKPFSELLRDEADLDHVEPPDPGDDVVTSDDGRCPALCARQHDVHELLKKGVQN